MKHSTARAEMAGSGFTVPSSNDRTNARTKLPSPCCSKIGRRSHGTLLTTPIAIPRDAIRDSAFGTSGLGADLRGNPAVIQRARQRIVHTVDRPERLYIRGAMDIGGQVSPGVERSMIRMVERLDQAGCQRGRSLGR
jgi:hypothetical protein